MRNALPLFLSSLKVYPEFTILRKKAYDAVSKAVEITQLLPDGELKLALIRYVYWNKNRYSVKDAAFKLYISRRTAERWHAEFVRLVGKCYGFEIGTYEPRICDKIAE